MDTVATMRQVVDETTKIVDGIKPDQLDNPTPCTEWCVRDLLNHITGGATMFAISAEQGSVPDDQVGQLMGGDNLGDDWKGAWSTASKRAVAVYNQPGVMDKIVKLPFGEMPAGMAINIAIFDVATHTWDLAKSTGQQMQLDPEVLAAAYELAQAMIPNMRAGGLVGEEVIVAVDAPMEDRLAGLAGRTP